MAEIRRLGALAGISALAMVASQVCFAAAIKSGLSPRAVRGLRNSNPTRPCRTTRLAGTERRLVKEQETKKKA